jgi:hypothetical protein
VALREERTSRCDLVTDAVPAIADMRGMRPFPRDPMQDTLKTEYSAYRERRESSPATGACR